MPLSAAIRLAARNVTLSVKSPRTLIRLGFENGSYSAVFKSDLNIRISDVACPRVNEHTVLQVIGDMATTVTPASSTTQRPLAVLKSGLAFCALVS